MSQREDPLAYGHYYSKESSRGAGNDSARGFVGDTFKKLKETYKAHHPPQGQAPPPQSNPGSYGGYQAQSQQPQNYQPQSYQSQGSSQNYPPTGSSAAYQEPPYQGNQQGRPSKPRTQDKVHGLLGKLQGTVTGYGNEFAQRLGTALDPQAYAEYGRPQTQHRFNSFAPDRQGNEVKWYVDGCSYFWAVSKALESARESIWILDWWLSPELYLRRPAAKNEQYRLDRMLQAAAQRGVRVNIIVYKEVTQALTLSSAHTKHHLEELHPNIAVFRHPDHLPDGQELASSITSSLQNFSLDAKNLAKMSGEALKGLYGMHEDMILYWAHHEKLCLIDGRTAFMGGLDLCFGRWDTNQHTLTDVHPENLDEIVFPGQDYNNARILDFQDVAQWEKNQLDRKNASRMGWSDVAVSLHGHVVEDLRRHFMERWNFIYDTKYHSRQNPKYARLALYGRPSRPSSSTGPHQAPQQAPQQPPTQQQPAVQQAAQQTGTQQVDAQQVGSQQQGFQQPAFSPQAGGGLSMIPPYSTTGQSPSPDPPPAYSYSGGSFPPPPPGPPPTQSEPAQSQTQTQQGQTQVPYFSPPPTQGVQAGQASPQAHAQSPGQYQTPYYAPPPTQASQSTPQTQTRGVDDYYQGTRGYGDQDRGFAPQRFREELTQYGNVLRGQLAGQIHQYQDRLTAIGGGPILSPEETCVAKSHGTPTEHSIADAYEAIIRNSEHFIYIENQFFITATGDAQKPVQNKIGAAIVERILRAARAGQKYKVIVVIPSVPCFAGDLSDESSLGTRAIMEFQYNSINRGGNSIMELIAKEGYNPMEYIRFYNLRNYDRINISGSLVQAEQQSGVNYEDARKQHDMTAVGQGGYGPGALRTAFDTSAPFQQYQHAAREIGGAKSGSGRWDSVSECYMLNGPDIRNVPWDGPSDAEIDAFVTEELYVHSKVMIADDRVVICGSANLNDRSQLGDHDSELAIIIEDFTPVQSSMNGKPWTASRFASSLRRQLFRKHLGLLPVQNHQQPDANFEPAGVPNQFDFDAPESKLVADPLADTMQSLWNTRARTNTDVFRKVFHSVPDDHIRNWATYKEFYGYYFHHADKQAFGAEHDGPRARYRYGHVVRDDFPAGPEGVQQVKELLSQVKGTLVEMPLMFLIEEDVAKEGLMLNDLTEAIYT
ncbi:putative phospholipase D (PLD) [Aspergillus tanneri]|uniref:phospholipase D n=1 Tax=Aspergillus tanneri TaxID=1220188 RepID=A0A5M9MS77_9EURO|nr:uncharacterized protein ATNIH1004_004073 [Aspergillus tanneri]KAA8648190.1 hypothetical protein ATNIH1004_004073 [Aspergillus tanneri]